MEKDTSGKNLYKHVNRFIGNDPSKKQIVTDLINEGVVSKAEIFRLASSGLILDTHTSEESVDGMKNS